MLLRYFGEEGAIDIEVPEGSRVGHRSHIQVGPESFLDDLLLVPWEGRTAPIPGEILPILARCGMYGLRLRSDPAAVESSVRAPEPRRAAR